MQFFLKGFTPEGEFRVFEFEGVDELRARYTVRADLAMSRRFGISLQALPLLCLGVLERNSETTQERNFTFAEENMKAHAAGLVLLRQEAEKKKASRKYSTPKPGVTWPASH